MTPQVCGTRAGVTAVQLDVKLQGGVPLAILEEALDHAKDARARILDSMEEALLPQTSPTFEGAFEVGPPWLPLAGDTCFIGP